MLRRLYKIITPTCSSRRADHEYVYQYWIGGKMKGQRPKKVSADTYSQAQYIYMKCARIYNNTKAVNALKRLFYSQLAKWYFFLVLNLKCDLKNSFNSPKCDSSHQKQFPDSNISVKYCTLPIPTPASGSQCVAGCPHSTTTTTTTTTYLFLFSWYNSYDRATLYMTIDTSSNFYQFSLSRLFFYSCLYNQHSAF